MSLEELRERNKELVVEKALECFIEKGIEHTTVMEIAKRANLTERSIFRYFPCKSDIVISASFLYWDKALSHTRTLMEKAIHPGMTGIEEISFVLRSYIDMVFTDPQGIRFTMDAEMALNSAGKNHRVINRPPEKFETSTGPMAAAVRRGLADGTIPSHVDVKTLYYNSYDAILGIMQRMTVGVPSVGELDGRARLEQVCDMFTREFAGGK